MAQPTYRAPTSCTEQDYNCDGQPDSIDNDGDGILGCDGDCTTTMLISIPSGNLRRH